MAGLILSFLFNSWTSFADVPAYKKGADLSYYTTVSDRGHELATDHNARYEALQKIIMQIQPSDWKVNIKGVEVSQSLRDKLLLQAEQNGMKWVKCGPSDFRNIWETHHLDFSRTGNFHIYQIDLYYDDQCTNLKDKGQEFLPSSQFVAIKAPYRIDDGTILVMSVSLKMTHAINARGLIEYRIIQEPSFEEVRFENGRLFTRYMQYENLNENRMAGDDVVVKSIQPMPGQRINIYRKVD